MVEPIFQRRQLRSATGQYGTVLGCLTWPSPVGERAVRLFLARGFDPQALRSDGDASIRVGQVKGIAGGAMALGEAAPEGALRLPGFAALTAEMPETGLFRAMRVLFGEYQGEPEPIMRDWIGHHRGSGVDAVLLLDRRADGDATMLENLAAELGLRRFVMLQSDHPLGAPDQPAATHPFHAPAAPGKDRMTELTSDPWRAPLGEMVIYELCRWRFLAEAAAVANLDPSDYLDPSANPFELVATHRMVRLNGARIYPWRVRKGAAARLHDHICRPFEPESGNRRWCLAPARITPEESWRMVHVSDVTPTAEHGFLRAMSIRHPDASPAEIVPKTALIEDPGLVARAEAAGYKPVRAPVNKPQKQPKRRKGAPRVCIVTCMKNEGPFILEWLAWHRAIGVTDVLVYTNDCTDGTDALLDLLQQKGFVQRRDNPFEGTGLKPQHAALQAAEKEDALRGADWAISMDVDEFINIHVGGGRLPDLFAAIGDANMISLTWRLFGNADIATYEDRFLIDQFTRCAPEISRKPHQAWGFKTLFANIGLYKKLGVHRPKGLKPDLWDQIAWVNGSGKPMPKKLYRNGWRSTLDSYGYDLVTLNHYAVRSAESFLVKRDRGRVNHVARDQGLNYWFRMNNNWEVETSIQRRRPLLVAAFDALMGDRDIAAAHQACVAAHRAKIAELRGRADYAEFYDALTSQRMKSLSRLHPHFGANVFLEGPQTVPDDVAMLTAPPQDFFFTVERRKSG